MIPASYLYKDVFTQAWGDPRNPEAEPLAPPRSGKGRFVGLIGLLTSFMPLEIDRPACRMHHV